MPEPTPEPTAGAWSLYADTRDRFIALVRPLDPERADRVVPITPGWTVTQVLAHVCGLNGDLAGGLRENLGSDERTSHQVATRAGRTVDELCGEWLGYGDAVEAVVAGNDDLGRRLAADLVVHLHDVQHAIGVPVDRADEASISGGRTYAARMVDQWFDGDGDGDGVDVVVDLGDASRFERSGGAGPEALVLRANAYDFLRSVTGRRSRAQVEALDWSGDPGPVLERFAPYGPLRTDDAEI